MRSTGKNRRGGKRCGYGEAPETLERFSRSCAFVMPLDFRGYCACRAVGLHVTKFHRCALTRPDFPCDQSGLPAQQLSVRFDRGPHFNDRSVAGGLCRTASVAFYK
jgi:hypothetical protein